MITTIIVVDTFVEDTLYNTLNILKNSSCCIIKLDLYSITKHNIHVKIREFITEEMETQVINISKILFVNFDILENNIETETIVGESSKLFNLDIHDPEFKSWTFMNDMIVTLCKSFEIDNVDLFDINHAIYYNSYKAPLSHVENAAMNNRSFSVSMNCLTKILSLEQSETLKTSTNWLNTLFGSLYTQNDELKYFLDFYFKINNTNLSFLENQSLENLNLFTKEFVELYQNTITIDENTSSANILLLPLHFYEENKSKLLHTLEGIKKDKCHVCLINDHDNIENINDIVSNNVNTVFHLVNETPFDLNLSIHVDSNLIKNGQIVLSKEIPTIDLNDHLTSSTMASILDSLVNNPKLANVKVTITNIYESEPEKALSFCEDLMSNYKDGKLTFILERTRNNYGDILYKPEEFEPSSFISHQEIYSENNITKNISAPFLLNFVSESSYDDFVTKTPLNQLILYDADLSNFLPEIFESKMPDTEILVYHSTETFSILKDKISQLKNNYNSSLNNVSLFKKNLPSYYFSLFNEEQSLKYDVEEDTTTWEPLTLITDISDISYIDIDEDYENDPSEENPVDSAKRDYYLNYNGPDPSLNSWEKISDFLLFLQDEIEVSNFDILTCKLIGKDWEYILDNLQSKTSTMTIHSSIDATGHVMFEADWILETPNNVNLVGLYFNDKIYDAKVELDSTVFTNWAYLRTAIKDLVVISSYPTTVSQYGEISTWIIGTNITNFGSSSQSLISQAVLAVSTYIPKKWSNLDGMNNWNVSHITSLHSAFAAWNGGNRYYDDHRNGFNSPIGSWDVGNVTTLESAFRNSRAFNKPIGNWNIEKVTKMNYTFQGAHRFNQPIDNWSVSNVTQMYSTFDTAKSFNQSLSSWDVANVSAMNGMFYYATSFDQDLSNWNVSNVTNFYGMFRLARDFSQSLGGSWKNIPPQRSDSTIVNGINTTYMFCTWTDDLINVPTGHIEVDYDPAVGFTSLNQLKHAFYIDSINSLYAESLFGKMNDWDVSKLTSLDELCTVHNRNYHTIEMQDWNVSNVTSMEKTFYGEGYFDCDLRNWDVGNVTNMKQMFYGAARFNSDISNWDTGNVTDMTQMFYNCQGLKYDLTGWNTSNADTTNMFQSATYYNNEIINSTFVPDYSAIASTFTTTSTLKNAINSWKTNRGTAQTTYGHISNWDVGAVTDYTYLFMGIAGTYFHEDLNNWDTSNVTNMFGMFLNCYNMSVKIDNWNISNVTSLSNAFKSCYRFNGDLSGWDVANVIDMTETFASTLSFNGHIEGWNVSKVTSMGSMFHTANYFNRDLTSWDIDNVTNVNAIFTNAEGIKQILKGKWMDLPERLSIAVNSFGTPNYSKNRVGIGFKNNGTNINSNYLLRQSIKLYVSHKGAASLHYPDISQWSISGVDNFDNLFIATYATNPNISGWNVSHVTSMKWMFQYCSEINVDFSNWDVGNVKSMQYTFGQCTYSEIKGVENWNVSRVTDMTGMFTYSSLFDKDISLWDVKNTTSINSMFSYCSSFNQDISKWKLESINKWGWKNGAEGGKGVYNAFYYTRNFSVELGQTWTILHDQINANYSTTPKTFEQYLAYLFNQAAVQNIVYWHTAGSVSSIPYNAPKITFISTDISNNTTYENDEIDMQIILTQDISSTDSITNLISATNGTIKNLYLSGNLTYSFVFESNAFGQTSEFNITSDANNPLSEYIVETFAWTWSPPATVMTFNSSDISNNQTQTTSSIGLEINLSKEFLTNEQLIQKQDVSVTNGVITGFQRVNNTQYTFTFIASSPNSNSVIQMDSSFDASNVVLPSSFTWTWSANIEQPSLILTSNDVANNATIKNNEINMLLTYTPNSKLAFSSLSENDISFTNGFVVNNTFSKISSTQYSFKFRSLSRDTNSTIFIPQNQFQYNFVDGATNLTENYEGTDVFTWKYEGLDIEIINNKTVAVITSDKKDSKSLDLILHNGVAYDPIYNEYDLSQNYISISGEIFNGAGEAAITFWYKTKGSTSNTSSETIMALRNSDSDNFTIQRYVNTDSLHIKSTGSTGINTTTASGIPFYNTSYVFMAVVFASNEIKIYKNNVLEKTESITSVINGGERTHQLIGASVSNASVIYKYFKGYIKNLRFYNYAIPSSEVNALYSMYNIGMNDTAPQILTVSLAPTTGLTSNSTTGIDEHTKAVINMEMNVTYDTISSISSIDSQSFIIDKSNFDTSFGYVFDFKQLSDTRVSFKFGASTTTENSTVLIKQDTITRNINSNLNVISNPVSNLFTWKYKSEPLTITSIKSNAGLTGASTNKDIIWIQTIFSEEVFNFRKSYITGTNCKVIKVSGSGTTYAIKVQTFRPTAASIVIDIPSSNQITTGKGLNKALANATNTTYNWNYDNIIPTFEIQTTQKSGLTNNADYVDVTIVTSRTTTNFDVNSINLVGSAEIVNFTGSGQNYSYRLQPFATSNISVEMPSSAFSDEYGNSNTSSNTFTWNYKNIVPETYISSQDINSGDSANVGSIETYFVFSKPVIGFTLADVDTVNGNLSDLAVSSTYPEHVTTYTVTVGAKSSSTNPYLSKGSSNAYFLNGEEAKVVSFVPGNTYTFNNSSNDSHPLKFYTNAEKTSGSEYTAGVTVNSTSTVIAVDSITPTTLFYQCEQHEYMGNIITYSESYKASLIPATSSVTISLQIASNKVKDSIDIFNDTASNTFIWDYTGTEYMVSIESSDLKSGASHLYKSIQVLVSLTYTTFETVDTSIFTVVNGSISNIVNNGDGTYEFTLESVTSSTETSILFLENSVTRSGGTETNKESNKFVWTYNPPIPQLTITTNDVEENSFTNNSSIDLQLDFTENVTLDMNMINISNAAGTLTGSNNSYLLNVIPNTITDSSADILVEFPEGSNGFYNYFDSENLYADISYSYSWKYDSIIPTGTISSSVGSIVQDICTNIQDVPFDIEFNKEITSLETNNFTVSANGALSGLSGSGSIYSFVISSLDNTIDNVITFKLGDGAITDQAGNTFSSTNEFSFTIAAKVSKVLQTAAIAELFTGDADIAEEDKLSSDEINMVLAVEIPDLSVPDFDAVEGGEVVADVSYTVTIDTKTSSNSYYSQGSSSAYFIDGTEAPSLTLDQDNVYRFNQDDTTNSGHPLLFFEDVDKSVQYTTDVSVNGSAGAASAYTQISITSETPATLYYQCGNHNYMGGTITIGEVDSIPVIELPPSVTITNSKVFTRLIDQILEKAEDVTAIKMSLDDVAISETATEKIPDVEQVIMAKSNQIEPPVVIENTDTDSVLFVPLANAGDLVRVEINGSFYLTEVNSDNTFNLTIDGVSATGSPFSKDDVYEIDDTNSIIFGSQIISSSPPPPDPPTLQFTSNTVQAGATTDAGNIVIDLSFSTTVEIDLNDILTLTSDTQITSSSIQSIDSSNSIISVSVGPILPDISATLGILINDVTFYSTYNSIYYYNDLSYSFSWNYDATEYNSANAVEVIIEAEPAFINPATGEIPCFLENTKILTTNGYKKVQELIPGKDKLIDHKNNTIECIEVAKYVKLNNGTEYPHKIPRGSQLSKDFICNDDLYLTYNHCLFLPTKNMFAPVSMMKNIKKCISDKSHFVYYHVFTNNYFSDTLIVNGIPCESHSKYTFNYLNTLDKSGKLLKKIMNKTNMLTNCQRNRISRKEYKKLIKKSKNKYKRSKGNI